jgi:hypothetical protein
MGRQVVVAAGGYLALLVLSLLAFIAAPAIVLPAFVLLSAWHFGLPLGGLAVAVALVPSSALRFELRDAAAGELRSPTRSMRRSSHCSGSPPIRSSRSVCSFSAGMRGVKCRT